MEKLSFETYAELSNRVKMPLLGFGAAEVDAWTNNQTKIVRTAIEAGYRLIDTAAVYYTERGVGQAVKESGIPRDKFFLTSKAWNADMRMGRKWMLRQFEETLRRLQTDYLDLYYMHWPVQGKFIDSYKVLEELYYTGRVRAIGISNVNRRHFLELMAACEVTPHAHQDEFHPFCMNNYNRIFDQKHHVHFEAFLPVVRGRIEGCKILETLAEKYNKSVYQIVIRWDLQHGVSTIPRSSNPKHIYSNCDVFDFELTPEDMAAIDSLNTESPINTDVDNFQS